MFKIVLTLFFATSCVSCTIVKSPFDSRKNGLEYLYEAIEISDEMRSTDGTASNLGSHLVDFLKLLDVQKMTMVAMQYMNDPEVMTLMKFLLTPQFKDLVWDFETMEEFKEAVNFLESKGYDMKSILDFVNTLLNLPAFEKSNYIILRNKEGISGFWEAMFDTLPYEDMKELFEKKLETSPEVAELFETINSQEFMDIMRKMRENPKFLEFKMIFESYGFDFKHLCEWSKEIFGDYYRGIFCD